MPPTLALIDRDDGESPLAPDELGAALYQETADVMGEFLAASFAVFEERGVPIGESQKAMITRELILATGRLPAMFEARITEALAIRAEVRAGR